MWRGKAIGCNFSGAIFLGIYRTLRERKMKRTSRFLASATVVLILGGVGHAAEPPAGKVSSAKVELKTPKKGNDKRAGEAGTAPFSIFVPDEVEAVRGVVFNPFHEQAVEQKHWRTAVAFWDFALVGANLFGVRKGDLREVVTDGLAAMAEASGHTEVANAAMCLVGMSAGGGMSVSIAEAMPERVIAAAPVCLEVGPPDEPTRTIPMITIFGERDGKQMEKLSEKFVEQRALGARWAIAVQWGRRHEFAKANNLIMPFFDSVIAQRYPEGASPKESPVALQPYPNDLAWFGEKEAWGESPAALHRSGAKSALFDVARACWFPDGANARLWQAFVVKTPKVRIAQPAGLGDGQPFAVHEAGEPVEVEVRVADELEAETIAVYRGDELLAEGPAGASSLMTPELPAGIHGLVAVATDKNGKRHFSTPHTILVR